MQAEIEREIWPPELRRREGAAEEEEGDGVLNVGRWVVGEGMLLLPDGEFVAGRGFLVGPGAVVESGEGGLDLMASNGTSDSARLFAVLCRASKGCMAKG